MVETVNDEWRVIVKTMTILLCTLLSPARINAFSNSQFRCYQLVNKAIRDIFVKWRTSFCVRYKYAAQARLVNCVTFHSLQWWSLNKRSRAPKPLSALCCSPYFFLLVWSFSSRWAVSFTPRKDLEYRIMPILCAQWTRDRGKRINASLGITFTRAMAQSGAYISSSIDSYPQQ